MVIFGVVLCICAKIVLTNCSMHEHSHLLILEIEKMVRVKNFSLKDIHHVSVSLRVYVYFSICTSLGVCVFVTDFHLLIFIE